jgi:hypothetical protein
MNKREIKKKKFLQQKKKNKFFINKQEEEFVLHQSTLKSPKNPDSNTNPSHLGSNINFPEDHFKNNDVFNSK